ncbi:lantibiotic dehydratase [Mucilaginibacter sp. BJC16-A38]|uniref:lantibiotic dehydratase n=1 Tax=Mucilaginibacter phenanthrenivorans TaxID=1234842 RepID=UPI002157468F|nr:lantibiotic dehydratase [Mucilaginibacter phenanthrenivorans]MCR8560429.1 lantibiotic dehydratase [Mucilaginibacter phenanthrenivorans]
MDQDKSFEFFDTLFLRAPFYSFEDYALNRMPEILAQGAFRNALWLASPEFYCVLEKKDFDWSRLGRKEQFSLYKYYNRMSFRPTPFGAFSSFSLVEWDEMDRIKLGAATDAVLHLLPSRQWREQYELMRQNKAADYRLRTNPTLNRVGNTFRFIKSVTSPTGKVKFQVNDIKAEKLDIYITGLCRHIAVNKSGISEKIIEATGCSSGDAREYLDFLISEQVFMTEFHGSLIVSGYWGNPPGEKISDVEMDPLENYWGRVAELSLNVGLCLPMVFNELTALDQVMDIQTKKSVFYASLERKAAAGGIDEKIQKDLLAAVSLLRRIVIPYPTPALKEFKDAFKVKFEGQRVPLLLALDPDTGISYGGLYASALNNGLLEDLSFPYHLSSVKQLDWTPVHRLFLRTWIRNPHRSFYEPVEVNDDDLTDLDGIPAGARFPSSIPVMFTRSGDKIILDNLGGATALSLIGRFSSFSPEVEALCKQVVNAENVLNPGVVFAEVHQLSDTHVDNVNRRTPLYDHVITINTFPGDSPQQEIPLNDLVLSIREDELWLESGTLGKRIIPRLPTAYNFHHNDLAIFQILCDLQFEGLQANLTFDLEKLFPGLDFYPRVAYKNVVISQARWRVTEKELSELLLKPLSIGRLHQWRQHRGIPSLITMGLSDQQLTFNLVNDEESLFFLDCLKENKTVTLREYIPADRKITAQGKALSGQFIALLKNMHAVYPYGVVATPVKSASKLQRDFPPGSEWLYLKIYCTPVSADKLLSKVIAPFLKANAENIALWFFIRYQDPEPHIRLRIKSKHTDAGLLLAALNKHLGRKQYKHLVRETKSETYQREIERYSYELMEAVEDYFCAGSELAVTFLRNNTSPAAGNDLSTFTIVYTIAQDFLKATGEVPLFFRWRSESFLKEFNGEKPLKVSLDSKYRKLGKTLETALDSPLTTHLLSGPEGSLKKLRDRLSIISDRSKHWTAERRLVLLADLIHMQVNRMFPDKQREHEALICYCLYKYSMATAARRK